MTQSPIGAVNGYALDTSLVHVVSGVFSLAVTGPTIQYWFIPLETRRLYGVFYFPERVVSYHRSSTGNALIAPSLQVQFIHQPDTNEIVASRSPAWSRTGWTRAGRNRLPSIDPITPVTVQHQESGHPSIQIANVAAEPRYHRVIGQTTVLLETAGYQEQQHSAQYYELHLARSGPYHWSVPFQEPALTTRLAVRFELQAPHLVRIDNLTGAALSSGAYPLALRVFAEV